MGIRMQFCGNHANGFASAMGAPHLTTNLGNFSLSTNQTLFIDISVPRNRALATVDWGDSSDYSMNEQPLSHAYAAVGNYDISVGICSDDNVVHQYSLTVIISGRSQEGNNTVEITPPLGTPANIPNTGFTNPIPLSDIPIGLYNTLHSWPHDLNVQNLIQVINSN